MGRGEMHRSYWRRSALFGDDGRLAGDFKPFAAAHVFAGHHVVLADHVGAELGEARTVAVIGTAAELALLGADDPGYFILGRLAAVRTIQRRWLLFLLLVKKIALFHNFLGQVRRREEIPRRLASASGLPANSRPTMNYCTFDAAHDL